jgi:hypothetical protein
VANPRKPVSLHKLDGTYQATRHAGRANEPRSAQNLADLLVPSFLSPKEKHLWRDILERAPRGNITGCRP